MLVKQIALSEIAIGERFRKDYGDLQSLADSMAALGLLQPIVVTPDNVLIAGERRLKAAVILGWDTITARVLDIEDVLFGEYAENEIRKDFTPSERVAIGQAVERMLGNRQGGDRRSGTFQDGQLSDLKGETRDLAAKRAGFGSGKQYERAKTVVEQGAPELVDAMDAGEVSVSAAAEIAKGPAHRQRAIPAQ